MNDGTGEGTSQKPGWTLLGMGKNRFSPCQKRILPIGWGSQCLCTLLCPIPPQPCPASLLGDYSCKDKQNQFFNPVTNTDNWNQKNWYTANILVHGKSISRFLRMKRNCPQKEQDTQVHQRKDESIVLKVIVYLKKQTNKNRLCIGVFRMVLKTPLESCMCFKIWS